MRTNVRIFNGVIGIAAIWLIMMVYAIVSLTKNNLVMNSTIGWITGFICSLLLIVFCSAGIQACNAANDKPTRIYKVTLTTGEVTRWVLPKGHKPGDTVHLTYHNGATAVGVVNNCGCH